jgi:hypothetical protein
MATCVLFLSCAVHHRAREPVEPLPDTDHRSDVCGTSMPEERLNHLYGWSCGLGRREPAAFTIGAPREAPPAARCPVRVRLFGEHVVAEPATYAGAFDLLPWDECIPKEYLLGSRHVVRVDDGFLVAYEGTFASEVSWFSEDGAERRVVSNARVVGFARGRSGSILALGVGRARLGRGGVLRAVHTGRGEWSFELAAVLPLTPSTATFDDAGTLTGYAQRFLFRVGEDGRVENIHYVSRDLGRVASIARTSAGAYYLGLECGILRLVPEADTYREEWWSAKDGASGRWSECPGAP